MVHKNCFLACQNHSEVLMGSVPYRVFFYKTQKLYSEMFMLFLSAVLCRLHSMLSLIHGYGYVAIARFNMPYKSYNYDDDDVSDGK